MIARAFVEYTEGGVYCSSSNQACNYENYACNRNGIKKETNRYICIKDFKLPIYDEDDCPTEEHVEIEKDSIWEVSKMGGESDVRLNLVEGDSDCGYIDITSEHLEKLFATTED